MVKKMQLKEEVLNLLERLDYETMSVSNIIATLIEGGSADVIQGKVFKRYESDYIEKFMEYEFAKQEVNGFVLEQIGKDNVTASWNLDFITNSLIVSYDTEDSTIKKVVRINVSEEELNNLQNLHFGVLAKRAIIVKLLDRHKLDTDTKLIDSIVFNNYQEELAKLERDYEREKERLSTQLLPLGADAHSIRWGFDFVNNVFEIGILCECGVDLFD